MLLFKGCAIATLLTLTLTSTAVAGEVQKSLANSASTRSEKLIAQFVSQISPFYQNRLMTEILIQKMQLTDLAQSEMKASDPEMYRMTQTLTTDTRTNRPRMLDAWTRELLLNRDR